TTGIFGLPVHPDPRPALISLYSRTLEATKALPETAVYSQAVKSVTQHRLSIVESTEDTAQIEEKIGAGQVEELIVQAEDELKLVEKMKEWKAWDPLETPAPEKQ
ncbi:ETC complex I subunit conserved region-domain-containing protein, partial [Hyaloraphidium curvatum]